MDPSLSSMEGGSKKTPLEELSKEDLLKKCKSLLAIAQKAKQAKDATTEENATLKEHNTFLEQSASAANEIIETITQQKLDLVTTAEELQMQKKIAEEKFSSMHGRMSELDTENISLHRQVRRLTDENEQLIVHLDNLEKKIQQLSAEGLQQQEQLLILEKTNKTLIEEMNQNENMTELQNMLARSLDEVKNLQHEVEIKNEKIVNHEICLKEKDRNIVLISDELQCLTQAKDNLQKELSELKQEVDASYESMSKYKRQIDEKDVEIQKKCNTMDDLNTELHKNRALIEILKQDIKSTNDRLSSSQILSSGVTSDLQNTNERMRDKLKFYHSKIVKLAVDIKSLKQNRCELLENFKSHTEQVKVWKDKLNEFAGMFHTELNYYKDEKERLAVENADLKNKLEDPKQNENNLETLKIQYEEINSKCKNLEETQANARKTYENANNALMKEKETLTAKLAQVKLELNTLHKEFNTATEDAMQDGVLTKQLQERLCHSDANLETLKTQYEEINSKYLNLEETHENAKKTYEMQVANTNNAWMKENETLTNELTQVKLERDALTEHESSLLQKFEELQSTYTATCQELDALHKEFNTATEDAKQDDVLTEQFKERLCQSDANLNSLKTKYEEINSKYMKLEETYENAKKPYEMQVANTNNALMKENETLTDELKQVKLERDALTGHESSLLQKFEELQSTYTTTCQELDALHTEFNTATEDAKQDGVLTEQLQERLCESDANLDTIKAKYEDFKIKYENLKETLESDKQSFAGQLGTLKNENQDLSRLLNEIRGDCEVFNAKKLKDDDELGRLQGNEEEIARLKVVNSDLRETLTAIKTQYEEVSKKYTESKRMHEDDLQLGERSSEEILSLVDHAKELTKSNESLQEQLEQIRLQRSKVSDACIQTMGDFPRSHSDLEEQLAHLKREHHEVLTEMNEMNQALKERGETISKQQAYCDELLKKMQILETQLNKKCETLQELEDAICVLQSREKELQHEMGVLRERYVCDNANDSNYESENMSTSTISKFEEAGRLKDLEGSWEERYSKLRTLALKLKGKIRDLSAEVVKEQHEKVDLQLKLAASVKSVQNLQVQYDKQQDELDSSKGECRNYLKKLDSVAADVSRDKKQLAANEDAIVHLKNELENATRDKLSTENWKKQVSSKVQALKKEIEANTVMRKEYETKIIKLTADLEAKEKALKEEREKHFETRSSLHESNNECKKQSVLNLEMQDYERSIKDLAQKLDKKQELVAKLKTQLETQKTSASALKDQSKDLEERLKLNTSDLEAAQQEVKVHKTKINDLEALLTERESKVLELTHVHENTRTENEELSTQLSTAIADNQKALAHLKSDRETLRIANLGLEQTIRELQRNLQLKEDEVAAIREKYQGYKVRAQSVLRQNQTRDVGTEEKLREEIGSMKAQLEILSSQLKEQRVIMESASKERLQVAADAEKLDVQNEDLKLDVEEWREKHGHLNHKYQRALIENAETIRGLKVHADTLSQCYRQQLSEQEIRHNREIIELQSKLEKGVIPPDIPALLLPSMPREEGEGSESVESTGQGSQPVPLEKLLGMDSDHELGIVRRQLLENESKVAHLTALLADTEQDLVKHVQMNKLLKEEIRRQQRSVEREQHAENLEYLKNVVFKFVTLGNGDERARLVPVLNTILKLSPDETSKLNLVARGDKSWSNYLPLWANTSQ